MCIRRAATLRNGVPGQIARLYPAKSVPAPLAAEYNSCRKEVFVRKLFLFAIFFAALIAFAQSAGRFDGTWNTTVNCDPKGGALGYTMHFVSTVSNDVIHGERGTPGQQGYLGIDGKIGNNGNAKLTANGNTASSAYTHGPVKTAGEEYSYEVKSQFTDTEGKGERSTGLGIVGRSVPLDLREAGDGGAEAVERRVGRM